LVPEGILLESEDTAALDQFQDHLMEVASANARTPSPPVVFYLKYVTADQAVKMLADLFDGGKSLATTPSGSLVRGDYGNDFYFGSFTSNRDGLTTVTAGTATIVSDARLNRLIIQGTTQDVAQIEGYLKIIDKGESLTDIETAGRSRVIELMHTKASEMAEVVKQAYAGRVANTTPGQAGNQPGNQQGNQPGRPGDRSGQAPPAESSDRQRGEGEQRGQREVVDKPTRDRLPDMTVAVHEPSNSLVITAPDALFAEVEALIRSVDQRGERVIEVIPAAQGVDLESILRQLQSGEASPTRSSGRGDSSRNYGGDRDRSDRDSRDRSRSR
jgi:type II secretory pathway component GspD/PulD (secretin)